MATIVNLHGPSGAGKSTLYAKLGQQLKDYARVDRENLKKNLRALDPPDRRRLSKAASVLLMRELMDLNKDILTMEFSPSNLRGKLEPTMTAKGYKFRSFYLQCPLQMCIERAQARNPDTDVEHIKRIYNEIDRHEQEDIVVNTADMNPDQAVEYILEHLN